MMVKMTEEPGDFEGRWRMCNAVLRDANMAYPRTCQECGLGPCKRGDQVTVGVDLAGGPDMTAVSTVASVPEQAWKLVPIQPDDNMAGELARDIVMWWSFSPPAGDALHRHLKRLGREIPAWLPELIADRMYVPPKGAVATAIYRAMLDAAPAAPQQEAGNVEAFRAGLINALDEPDAEMLAAFQQAFSRQLHRRRHKPGLESAELAGIRALLKVAMDRERPPAAPQQAELSGDDLSVEFKRGWDAALAAAPQQAEPVAWRHSDTHDLHDREEDVFLADADSHAEPLYLHPPADEVQRLRDAARDVCEWADAAQWALGNETGVPAAKLDALRRALEGGE